MQLEILIGTALMVGLLLSGCASVRDSKSMGDGKCHGADYNAPDCVYLF